MEAACDPVASLTSEASQTHQHPVIGLRLCMQYTHSSPHRGGFSVRATAGSQHHAEPLYPCPLRCRQCHLQQLHARCHFSHATHSMVLIDAVQLLSFNACRCTSAVVLRYQVYNPKERSHQLYYTPVNLRIHVWVFVSCIVYFEWAIL